MIDLIRAIFAKNVSAIFGKELKIDLPLEVPPDAGWGDFAVPVFLLAKELKQNPALIAKELADNFQSDEIVAKAEARGPYVNLKLTEKLFQEAVKKSAKSEEEKAPVMIEYLSPNTNKPLHLGHVRNGLLGTAAANLLDYAGHPVQKTMVVNDRGIHICKSMLAWEKFGEGETPESNGLKGDHLVGKYYVKFAEEVKKNPELAEEAQAMLRKWEEKDPAVQELWQKMNGWVCAGFEETFERLGFNFDFRTYESEIYTEGKRIVEDGLARGVFEKDEKGAVIFNLPEDKFGLNQDGSQRKMTMLRADGTSVYITQDLALAVQRAEKYQADSFVYVVGAEQDDYFKRLFAILKALGYAWADKCYHLSYAMIELTTGKMKSREGTVVDADDLIDQMEQLARNEIKKRNSANLSEKQLKIRANKIGLAAIKFFLLKSNPAQRIIFDPQESISFEGVTGPYCQYVYARANSVLKKGEALLQGNSKVSFSLLGEILEERILAQKLVLFETELEKAVKEYNPASVAMAVYELAKAFNQWYGKCRVVDEKKAQLSLARLELTKAVMEKIKAGLTLLGIEVLEEM